MKTKPVYYAIVLAAAVAGLFIPAWMAPFFLGLATAYWLKSVEVRHVWIHFGIYTTVCFLFGLYVSKVSEAALVGMIGEIFRGLSAWQLALVSGLIFGGSAAMGAWLGKSFPRKGE